MNRRKEVQWEFEWEFFSTFFPSRIWW